MVSQTIFVEYSVHGKTDPFMKIFHIIPEQNLHIQIGSVYQGRNEDGEPVYILTDRDGTECFNRTASMQEAKWLFTANGHQMAERKIKEHRKYSGKENTSNIIHSLKNKTMNTNNNQSNQQAETGQTIFEERTKWKKGEHFITAKQDIPGSENAIVFARVFLEVDENRKATYICKDINGHELFPPSKNLIDLKKQLKEHGKQIEVSMSKGAEQAIASEQPEIKPETAKAQEISADDQEKKQEVKEVRLRKESKSQDNERNR